MKNNKSFLIFLLITSFFLVTGAVLFNAYSVFSLQKIASRTSEIVEKKVTRCEEGLNLWFEKGNTEHWQEFCEYYTTDKIGLYFWKKDSLVFWNNSQIPLHRGSSHFQHKSGLIKLTHGYYVYVKVQKDENTGLALCLLKPTYELQNNYLKNNFREWTGIPKPVKLDTAKLQGTEVFLRGQFLFSLKGNEGEYYQSGTDNLGFFGFFLGFFVLLLTLSVYAKQQPALSKTLMCALLIMAFRLMMIWFKWPAFFYRTELYDLQLFGNAQSFLNGYLGDILLNALTLLFVVFLFKLHVGDFMVHKRKYMATMIIIVLLSFLYNQFNQTAVSLINNSTLSFNFLSIFNIKFPAYVGIAALSIYSLAIFLVVNSLLAFFTRRHFLDYVVLFSLFLGVCIIQQVLAQRSGFFENYWLLVYAFVLLVLSHLYTYKLELSFGLQILMMSIIVSRFFNTYIHENQVQDLGILSAKLSEKQDPILESEFDGIPSMMEQDKSLNNILEFLSYIPTAEREAELLLKQKYFSGYFERYTIDFSLFDEKCHPLLKVRQPVLMNEGFFDDQIRYNSDSTSVAGLFFVKNYKKNVQYIGKIRLKNKTLYLLMEPKQSEELGSFPDLLLDQSQQKPEKLKDLSHAVYRSNLMTSRYGDFNYPFSLQDSAFLNKSDNAYVHYYYTPDENTTVIISQKAKNWNYFFTFNSYLLLFFSFITYIFYLLHSFILSDRFNNSTLTRRLQTIIIGLLLLAMSAVGVTSGKLVTSQFTRNNKKQLEEKTQIIVNELTEQFKSDQFFDPLQKELINLKLKEYSRLFSTPISLFFKNGELYNTSESKLYELGLAAPFVNPGAFWKLNYNQSSEESVTDKAGSLKYQSLYTPLFDKKRNIIGFINLPYFARQSDLVNELSGIISALINVYVILFVISILAGLILSGFITQPLRLIKQQLSNVTLGKTNEKIIWESDDEIGKLVSEYNNMLEKLEHSAGLLAQSEREGAWREMAKQVAHEIKNPLTPMKLNLQYLQHLMKSNPDDFNEKFERVSAGIIEQIDSLAIIATEFSNFAKLPKTQLQTINLVEVINASVHVFENQKNVLIKNTIAGSEILVKGDREQCLRVFNNLLKNSVQALEETAEPVIQLDYHRTDEFVIVSVKDNGCGIAAALQAKIFTPNFTTKTTGSGLGLAMVKNIMLGFEGDISFLSDSNSGTTFFLQFKMA